MKALHSSIPDFDQMPAAANAGLWYDKYCDKWREVPEDGDKQPYWSLGDNKQDWIDSVTRAAVGDQNELKEVCKRREQLAREMNAKPQLFKTDWRFVTGLGQAHPVENGFAWHHSLGVPYLPGSSVKGMVRAWAEQWEKAGKKETKRIFGPKGTGTVGSVIFFDALPVSTVTLETDIMTPHYGPWYSNGEAPGDWHDPVPIPFLTVADGQTFQFLIAPRQPGIVADVADAEAARIWLKDALEWCGAGAKTAAGYGRFEAIVTTCDWVDTQLEKISENVHCTTEEALRGKKLAKAWSEINDPDLKKQALECIKKRWEQHGWWGNPQGRAMKMARNIYDDQST